MSKDSQNLMPPQLGEILSRAAPRRYREFTIIRNLYLWTVAVCAILCLAKITQNLAQVSVPVSDLPASVDVNVLRIPWENAFKEIPFALVFALALPGIPIFIENRHTRAELKRLRSAMDRAKSVEAISHLTPWLESSDKRARRLADFHLTKLLPSMQASNANLLTDEDHERLNRQLRGKDISLVLAILSAYRQVGDHRDELAVRYLCEGLDSAGWNSQVQQAAEDCLSYIEARAENYRASQTLLRAANASGNPSEVLVRPAYNSASTAHENLVRPAEVNVTTSELG